MYIYDTNYDPMKQLQKTFIALSLPILPVLSYLIVSCVHDPNLKGMSPVCFDTEVLPILQTSCDMKGCHDGTGETFQLTDYQSAKQYVKAGNPSGSSLYQAISNYYGENRMPPNQPLTKLQRSIIEVWIAQGANEVICRTDTTGGGGGGGHTSSDSVCFVQNILPLFIANCAMSSCHDGLSTGEDNLYCPEYVCFYKATCSSVQSFVECGICCSKRIGGKFHAPSPEIASHFSAKRTHAEMDIGRST